MRPEASLVRGEQLDLALTLHGRAVHTLSWPVPEAGTTTATAAEMDRQLQWQARLTVVDRRSDRDRSLRMSGNTTLTAIRPASGQFVAGSVRRRGVCRQGVESAKACYQQHYEDDDNRLCAQAPQPDSCYAAVREATNSWYEPTRTQLVVLLVTSEGTLVSKPQLDNMLGKIDTPEEARIVAAMATDVWDDSPVLELGDGEYIVYTSPIAIVRGASVSHGIRGGCAPARNPAWANPSLNCRLVRQPASCNGVPQFSFDCSKSAVIAR